MKSIVLFLLVLLISFSITAQSIKTEPAGLKLNNTIELSDRKNTDSENQHPSTLSVGIGEFFILLPNRLNLMANFSANLDLSFNKTFFLKIGLDVFDHHSHETKWMIYLGPELNFNLLEYKRISLSIYTGAIGIAATDQEGLGFTGSLFFNPVLKYEFKYFALGVDLRNYLTLGFTSSKANYFFNPVLAVIIKL